MKFSIVIIGFNQAKTIAAAVSSALKQTGGDVEVFFVNDASTDDSVALLEQQFGGDTRLKIISHRDNQGPLISRLDGVDAATGDYILFLDGDDELSPDACSVLAKTISAKKGRADMIGFGAKLVYTTEVDAGEKQDIENLLSAPRLGWADGAELCRSSFILKETSHVVWNKCYSAALARRVSESIVRDKLMLNEDYYFSFVACTLCEKYYGISNKLYLYSFGHGISTAARLSMPAYERALTAARANAYCTDFAKKQGVYREYAAVLAQNRKAGMLNSFFKLSRLPEQDKARAAGLMIESYGMEYAVSALAEEYWWSSAGIAGQLDIRGLFPVRREKVKTVAMFYHRLYNGGVERTISLLCELLSQAGYRLVVITDQPVNEKDYPLPEGTARLVISDGDQGRDYEARYQQLISCIQEYQVDAVVYNAWLSPCLFWDMCTVKSTGAAFIVHAHSVFIAGLNEGWSGVMDYRSILPQADSLITLSEADQYFWSKYCPRVYSVNNPLTFDPRIIPPASLDSRTVLWLGRFDQSAKNPGDALEIIQKVRSRVPDVKLIMAGAIGNKDRQTFEGQIAAMGLTGCVSLPGYCSDVQSLFQRSAVHLMTTNYEGFCMTLSESLANGVPVVTYELPYMTLAKDSQAVKQVPWKDTDAAADAVAQLLLDGELRRTMGQAGRAELTEIGKYDYAAVWAEILSSAVTEPPELSPYASPADVVIATLELGLRQSFRSAGKSSVPAPPARHSKLRTLFRVLREKGLAYTLRLVRRKIRGK